ncbi:chorismate synthase [Candidatus Margulisiibacteriota bacterium]
MSGNTFGQNFRITTFGESHGAALGVIIDGCPAQIEISERDIQKELDRRKPGQSKVTTPRKEADKVEILSGIFDGKTTGTPIALIIYNTNVKSKDYSNIKDVFRPGHADFGYWAKYGFRDYRGGGRSSGRETAARVAAGAIAKKILNQKNISIAAYTSSIAGIKAENIDLNEIENNIVRCPDKDKAGLMIDAIEKAAQNQDSLGGTVEAIVKGLKPGIGEPVFDKLNAVIAHALFSIGGVKGLEFGTGFQSAKMKGSEYNDPFYINENSEISTKTNNSGGILGGISTGNDIKLKLAIRPTPSISQQQKTVTQEKTETTIEVHGRHDPCICPRIIPVVEAMLALVILDLIIENK